MMGHGYKGGAGHYHSISENISSLKADYDYHNGYFGEKGQGRSHIRNIFCDSPMETSRDFYNKASCGGIEHQMKNGKGVYSKMKDGSILSYRVVSSSDGTPAVEINIKNSNNHGDVKNQKIHFVKGE